MCMQRLCKVTFFCINPFVPREVDEEEDMLKDKESGGVDQKQPLKVPAKDTEKASGGGKKGQKGKKKDDDWLVKMFDRSM